MMNHNSIQLRLYSYLQNESSADERRMVEEHLASCIECADQLAQLRSAVELIAPTLDSPSSNRTDEFWDQFALNIQRRIREQEASSKKALPFFPEIIDSLLVQRWRIVAATLAVGAILGSLLWLRLPRSEEGNKQEAAIIPAPQEAELVTDRANQYFQRTKLLLVGVANMKTVGDEPVDLSAEKRVSQDLVREARYLKQQPLDDRSAKLIGSLDRILIELANLEQQTDVPNVEMIRSGIHRENLLFKIRMAQPMYDSTRIMIAKSLY